MTIQARHPFRLIVVSNRGPYELRITKQGLKRDKTVGGLVTSLLPLVERQGGVWIAWGDPPGRYAGQPGQSRFDLRYIGLTGEQLKGYYLGFANNALWPLCHYFLGRVHYDETEWQMYERVNERFAQTVLEEAHDGDVVWVHDYHLSRVPHHLRRVRPQTRILFFWHIPFPPAELFRTLPWRHPFLASLLTCDLIGFHVPEYLHNFNETAIEVLGAQVQGDCLLYGGHATRVVARPIGIEYDAVHRMAQSSRTLARAQRLRESLPGQQIILGVERMDYTKGICERLQAIERLLEGKPELHGLVSLIQIVTPSRNDVEAYRLKKREIDEIVGRINGRFSNDYWMRCAICIVPSRPRS